MLGLDSYGSDGESESEAQQPVKPQARPTTTPKASKSSIVLPPPSSSGTGTAGQKVSLPPPKAKRAPKKISIGLPTLSRDDDEEKGDVELDRPAAKRQKTGAGASSLLSMLPAPKQKAPPTGQTERVLGGGRGPGLVFNTKTTTVPAENTATSEGRDEKDEDDKDGTAELPTRRPSPTAAKDTSSLPFRPPSIVKGKVNISLEDNPKPVVKPPLQSVSAAPNIDSFSIGNSKSTSSHFISNPSLPTLSSAPTIPTFEPPEPTPQDPYPGYYQLPSGSWAAYDPQFYEGFRKKWQAEYDAYVRKLEKGAIKGFEGYEEGASEVDAMKEMEKAKVEIQEREEKKALTKGATGQVAQPNMKVNASKLSGIARSRHQLSTLLRDAYENREMLEEKIAEGRRNRKEAGNKYGF